MKFYYIKVMKVNRLRNFVTKKLVQLRYVENGPRTNINDLVQKKRPKSVTFIVSVMFFTASYCFTFENKWESEKQKNTLEHILQCYLARHFSLKVNVVSLLGQLEFCVSGTSNCFFHWKHRKISKFPSQIEFKQILITL